MPQFNQKQDFWQILFGILIAFFVGVSLINYFRYISLPTDENLFRTSPSGIYVTKSFPVLETIQEDSSQTGKPISNDSVRVGDLLVQVNWRLVSEPKAIIETLQESPDDSLFSLLAFRPQWNKYLPFKVAKSAIADSFFRKTPTSVYIMGVIPGGASDRAGLKKGDLIYRINGSMFRNQDEADAIMRQASVGKGIAYDVLRDNRTLTLQVTLAGVGINLSVLILCLSGLFYMGVGAYIALHRAKLKAARLLSLALLMTGFFMTLLMTQRAPVTDTFIIVRNLSMVFSLCFSMAVFAHSRLYFPIERPEIIAKRWVTIIPYAIAIVIFIATINIAESNFADKEIFIMFAIAILYILTIFFSLVVEFLYRKKRPVEYKQLRRVISWTCRSACVLAVGLGFYLYIRFGENGVGFIGLPLALIPLAYLYTIGRYRLLDLDLRIRRNIQYTIVSTIWILLVAALLITIIINLPDIRINFPNFFITGTGIEFADTQLPEEKRVFIEKIFLMFGAIALCLLALKFAKKGQAVINRKFDQDASDYRKASNALAEVMGTNLTMVDLAKGIVQKLALTLHLKRVGVLFFRNQKMCCCQEAYGFEEDEWFDFCIAINPKLIDAIGKFRSESRFSTDYLTGDLKKNFTANGFRNIFIIRSKDKLVGALLIGDKRSESPFHQDDMEFLSTIAKQASVAIENAFLYEELAGQERLKHELEIARRIQLASLPQSTPIMEGLEIDGVSVPALEVGGDYFDYLNGQPNEITVIVGDVSGKGTSAALYMSKVQGILRSLHGFNLSPRDFFIHANNLLCNDLEKKSFVTVIGGFFNSSSHVMRLARAGHLPLYYYNAKAAKVEFVTPKGLGLGLKNSTFFARELEEKKIKFKTGDIFLFITDGITEAHNTNGDEFGEERVAQILSSSHHLPPNEIRTIFFSALQEFATDTYQHDDQTLVVVKVK